MVLSCAAQRHKGIYQRGLLKHIYRNCNAYGFRDGNADSDTHCDTHGNPYRNTHAYRQAYAHSYGNAGNSNQGQGDKLQRGGKYAFRALHKPYKDRAGGKGNNSNDTG